MSDVILSLPTSAVTVRTRPVGLVCRKHGISDATFYNWKSKYGGLTVSDAARLRALEDENRRLKKLLAESMLDVSALKDLLGKN